MNEGYEKDQDGFRFNYIGLGKNGVRIWRKSQSDKWNVFYVECEICDRLVCRNYIKRHIERHNAKTESK